jgi:hypothetical protein
MHFVCANIFGTIVLKLRFKIDVVVIIIGSIVIIINSVLTLQVSTASLPHDREPCKKKVVSNHTCSLHTCVCAGSRRVRVRLSGLINGRNQFNSWGSLQVPHSGPGLCRKRSMIRMLHGMIRMLHGMSRMLCGMIRKLRCKIRMLHMA